MKGDTRPGGEHRPTSTLTKVTYCSIPNQPARLTPPHTSWERARAFKTKCPITTLLRRLVPLVPHIPEGDITSPFREMQEKNPGWSVQRPGKFLSMLFNSQSSPRPGKDVFELVHVHPEGWASFRLTGQSPGSLALRYWSPATLPGGVSSARGPGALHPHRT